MRRRNARLAVACAVMLAVAAASLPSARAQGLGRVEATVSQLNKVAGGAPAGPARGAVILLRDDMGVTAQIRAADLEAGAVYTVWWVIFNNPAACSTDPCSTGDPDPEAIGLTVLWATAFIATERGIANVDARLDKGQTPGLVVRGEGLKKVRRAEVHVALASHGSARRNTIVDEMQVPASVSRGAIFKAQ